ncbi:hypothetical protein S40288_01640 [Stachybotrys chartarum IBT 40288]|nr:hypothetical protein S40288_01640 [Stachybotrys chartarum IBT 40288]
MLSQHARNGLPLRRVASLGGTRQSAGWLTLHATKCTAVRRYVVPRLLRPQRRSGALESRIGYNAHERNLATAVDDFKFGAAPYNDLTSTPMPPFQSSSSYSYLRAFDPSSAINIAPPVGGPKAFTKINQYGIPGDTEDMLPIFDACLRVGKLDRAALVLKRLNSIATLSGEERILLNNQYLRASLDQMRTSPDRGQAEQLHKWYELQIRNANLPQTAETVACMLKASLLSERGDRLTRLVKRYMSMAPAEAGLRVLSMADILSDQDLAVITEICPRYNFVEELEYPDVDATESKEMSSIPASELTDIDPASLPTSAAEITPTQQRGHGLETLKRGLSLLRELEEHDVSKLSEADRRGLQVQLERDAIDSALWAWRQDMANMQKAGINPAIGSASLSQQVAMWLNEMETALRKEFQAIDEADKKATKSKRDKDRCLYGPFLQQSDPARLAAVTILSILSLGTLNGADKGIVVSRIIINIGKVVQEDIEAQRKTLMAKDREKMRRKVSFSQMPTDTLSNPAETAKKIVPESDVAASQIEEGVRRTWTVQLQSHVGAILLKTLIDSARVRVTRRHPTTNELIAQDQPAFTQMQQPRRGKKVGTIHFNTHLVEKLKREPVGDHLAKHLPMLVQPKPWKSYNSGGFLHSKTSLVRIKTGDVEQKLYSKEAIKRGDMDQVLKALDVLGKTSWKINKNTLNVMIEAWNSGEAIANFPPLTPDSPLPAEPDSSADPNVRRQWARQVKAIQNVRSGYHSQRCYMNLQLEIARAFRNQTLYFPHNVDYRGRAYPMPTYLNHMGADHTRAILLFAEGRELGARGLRWLKIHLANLYGLDKANFDDREAFATDNMSNIIDSATNPLNGKRWWLEAEDPWQCLSACFELKAAHELPDPTKYRSHLPVHQDGTCNGLQHYAALGGDSWGAKQVNLEPAEKPADVYTAVANLVKEAIVKDAAAGHRFAQVLEGKITRKVVKQTVMTNVYGVTFQGAKKQVCKQIDALYGDLGKQCDSSNILLSTYVAKHIFTALATMFRGAHDIQYWLGEVGGRVCRALTPAQIQQIAEGYPEEGSKASKAKSIKNAYSELMQQFCSTVVWTTPLRMPVAQPYRKPNVKEVKTCLQSLNFVVSDQTNPVNRKKQLQGFPPNFIHSLDASHMLLSALKCDELGLSFAAVHDSFWTHASDVDQMSEVLRDAFIQIHEEDVVGRLASEFEARHKGSIYLAHINPDSPVALKIKALRQNSKLSPKEELLLEHKRLNLMMSGNPWDLEAAKKIITPASVYEEMKALEEDLMTREELEGMGLGVLPSTSTNARDTTENEALAEDATLEAGNEMMAEEAMDGDLSEEVDGESAGLDDTESSVLSDAGQWSKALNTDEGFEVQLRTRENKPRAPRPNGRASLPVWLPLTIPPVPQKGDFNVSRLRESKYFFS